MESAPRYNASASGKRARKGTACSTCRTRKYAPLPLHPAPPAIVIIHPRRRCNGGTPICSSCMRFDEPDCKYTVLKLRPRTSILQQKIDELEAQLGRFGISAASTSTGGSTSSDTLLPTLFPEGAICDVAPHFYPDATITISKGAPMCSWRFHLSLHI